MSETIAPRDYAELCSLIAKRQGQLPKRLSQVAAYAFHHPDEIAFGTAASIAESAGVQPSTLVRFAQSLGYQGFSDLQEVFQSRLRERVLSYEERLEHLSERSERASTVTLLWQGFRDAAERSLAELDRGMEPARLEAAVDRLAKARMIYLVGLRRSLPVSSYMSYAFGQLGVASTFVTALGGMGAEQIGLATPQDVVLAVSFAPYASETVALVGNAAARNVPIVAITDSAVSPLTNSSDVWIEVGEANFEGFRSLAATLALAMTLTVAVAQARRSRPNAAKRQRRR